jgi:ATP-dependent helicase/nuclease subunit A
MNQPAPQDQAIRNQIGPWSPTSKALPELDSFEPDTNFVVAAAAGSGKTTALVGRMVSLVRSGVPVGDLVAITFTKKAAGEMQGRFYKELRAAWEKATDDEEKRYLRQALDELSQCFIGTIHSFCARLLRGRSEQVGIPRDFTAGLEEREERELRDQFWQQYLQASWTERRGEMEALIEAGVDLSELKGFFGELVRVPELEPYVDGPMDPPDLSESVRAAQEFIDEWREFIPETRPEKGPDRAMKALQNAQSMLAYLSMDDRTNQVALLDGLLQGFRSKRSVTLKRWTDKDRAKTLREDAYPFLIEHVLQPTLRAWQSYVYRLVASFVHGAVDAFRQKRWAQGQLTFHDLLLAARDLLQDHPDVRRSLRKQYPRLLVDEFQDTDPVQAEVLFYLTHEGAAEPEYWKECNPAPGSLFIVGDDKQSIYSFREADIDLFDTVRGLIKAQPHGKPVKLRTNFRSAESICTWCDEAFGALFEADQVASAGDGMVQAEYVPFEPWKSDPDEERAVRQLRVPYVKGQSSSRDIARRNAHQIARFIRHACEADARKPGDFMILTRDTTRLSIYAEVLAEKDVPYVIAGGKDAGTSEELRGLIDLLASVYRPDDPVARIAYLRGPLVGLSDEELYRFRQAGGRFDGPFDFPTGLREELGEDLTDQIKSALDHLRAAQRLLQEKRPAAAIERIAERTGMLGRALQDTGQGSLKAGRLLRVLTEVRHLDGQGAPWAEILEELERVLSGDAALDGMTLETGQKDGGDSNSVQLLNVHKAKGLEAKVVFLADPYNSRYPRDPERHVRRAEGEVVQPVFIEKGPYQKELKYGPKEWHARFEEVAKRAQWAEEHRLQYVAATRAEELLVISRYEKKEDKGYWAHLYDHLDQQDLPNLGVPESATSGAAGRAVDALDLPALRRRRQSAFDSAAAPAFELTTVTQDKEEPEMRRGAAGYGSSFGSAVHVAFEVINRQRREKLEGPLIKRVLREHLHRSADAHEVTEDHVRLARQMLEGWTSSTLWKEVKSARQVLPEVPVATYEASIDETSDETGQASGSKPERQLVRGVIDLAFETEDGWTLVDFKTDRVPDQDALERLTETYAPQVSDYARYWQQHTQGNVHQAGLWLADAETWVEVIAPGSGASEVHLTGA